MGGVSRTLKYGLAPIVWGPGLPMEHTVKKVMWERPQSLQIGQVQGAHFVEASDILAPREKKTFVMAFGNRMGQKSLMHTLGRVQNGCQKNAFGV